jgi:Meckel syndrome type 1 protein
MKFCKICGHSVANVAPAVTTVASAAPICPACHADLPVGARFCKSCGADLRTPSSTETSLRVETPPPVPPTPIQTPIILPTQQPIVPETVTKAAGRNNALRIGLVILLLIVVIGVGMGIYVVVNMNRIEAPVIPAERPTETVITLPGAETPPEKAEEDEPFVSTPVESSVRHDKTHEKAPPPVAKPVEPKRDETARMPTESESGAEPQQPRTCDGLTAFSILLCRTEGAARFWHCAPDGVNWNNDIPGCQRNTGRNNRLY